MSALGYTQMLLKKARQASALVVNCHASSGTVVDGTNNKTITLNTTGSQVLIIGLQSQGIATVNITETGATNTWTQIVERHVPFEFCAIYSAVSPNTSATHSINVQAAGSTSFCIIGVNGFGGTPTIDPSTNGYSYSSATSITNFNVGSVTPSQANNIVVTMVALNQFGTTTNIAIDSGFTISDKSETGAYIRYAFANLIQTTATSQNPKWSWTGGDNTGIAGVIAIIDDV